MDDASLSQASSEYWGAFHDDAPEYEPEEDGDYLDSLERDSIDGPHYYERDDMDFVDAQFFDHDF